MGGRKGLKVVKKMESNGKNKRRSMVVNSVKQEEKREVKVE